MVRGSIKEFRYLTFNSRNMYRYSYPKYMFQHPAGQKELDGVLSYFCAELWLWFEVAIGSSSLAIMDDSKWPNNGSKLTFQQNRKWFYRAWKDIFSDSSFRLFPLFHSRMGSCVISLFFLFLNFLWIPFFH